MYLYMYACMNVSIRKEGRGGFETENLHENFDFFFLRQYSDLVFGGLRNGIST